jgi:hypothetical protein
VRNIAIALNVKFQLLFFQYGVALGFDAGDPIIQGLEPLARRSVRAD